MSSLGEVLERWYARTGTSLQSIPRAPEIGRGTLQRSVIGRGVCYNRPDDDFAQTDRRRGVRPVSTALWTRAAVGRGCAGPREHHRRARRLQRRLRAADGDRKVLRDRSRGLSPFLDARVRPAKQSTTRKGDCPPCHAIQRRGRRGNKDSAQRQASRCHWLRQCAVLGFIRPLVELRSRRDCRLQCA